MTSTPLKTVRLSVPVTLEVQATFQRLAEVSGKSMAASMSQWLSDTKEAADLMADNLERLRGAPGDMVMRVRLHTSAIEDAAEEAIEQAISRAEQDEFDGVWGRGGAPRSRGSAAPQKPLTPPSSNTGGKVHGGGKKPGV